MHTVIVKDRGRAIAVHRLETRAEADEVARVYALLGYAADKITVEFQPIEQAEAA